MRTLKLKDDIYWVGVLDPNLKVFDVIVETEFGTSYNAYVVKGSEKTAIFETAKENFLDEYIEKLEEVTPISEIDYLVVNHTEPDHAGSVKHLLEKNPNITIVGSRSAINFMREMMKMLYLWEIKRYDLFRHRIYIGRIPCLHTWKRIGY